MLAGVRFALAMNRGQIERSCQYFSCRTSFGPPPGAQTRCIHPAGIRWVLFVSMRLPAHAHTSIIYTIQDDMRCGCSECNAM